MRHRLACGLGVFTFLLASAGALVLFLCGGKAPGEEADRLDRFPSVRPDLAGITVPPNVAPLNFRIEEEGAVFYVKLHAAQGRAVGVFSGTGVIRFPPAPWRRLLEANRGGELHLDVYVQDREGRWSRFETISLGIAREEIDGYVAYRRMHPTRAPWSMSINCREVGGFGETEVLGYRSGFDACCVNCHTPLRNAPDRMLLGFRGTMFGTGTLLLEGGAVHRLGTKLGYTSWHPSGKLAAYSVNDLPLFFHTARKDLRDTADRDSYIASYRVKENATKTCPQLSRKNRLENWPVWAPDGRYLYFCAAPKTWKDPVKGLLEGYQEIRYDLERIGYDVEADRWGRVETLLSAERMGKSIAMPRISPDGRWLSFCMFDYGFFPNWREESDLYLIDLEDAQKSGKYECRKLELNSACSESWHSWSSNSRWIVFSSKRDDGIFTRLYFSYIDDTGKDHKPFVLPQEDPGFYDSCLEAFNTAEFLVRPVPVGSGTFRSAVRGSEGIPVDAVSMPTAKPRPAQPSRVWE